MSEDELKKQTEILREILKWVKFSGINEVKDILNKNLDTDTKKLVYHFSDGKNTSRDFKDKAKIGKTAVAQYWLDWSKVGIVETISVEGGGRRGKKIFDLEEFGITLPQLDKSNSMESKDDYQKMEGNADENSNIKVRNS